VLFMPGDVARAWRCNMKVHHKISKLTGFPIMGRILSYLLCFAAIVVLSGCSGSSETERQVIVYTSVDDIFARPVANNFQTRTGIKVHLVTDTEETKSTGLLNRLIAEKKRPVADVFWSGDPVRAAVLKKRGISAPYNSPAAQGLPSNFSDPQGYWTAFSTRARVIIYNTDIITQEDRPHSVFDLNDPSFSGKACVANPLFGTTSMHAAALFQVLGKEKAEEFFNNFTANGGRILGSNGDVKDRVAAGECAIGLTDTDDVNMAISEKLHVGFVFPDQDGMGTLLIPNCAVLINGAPHVEEAKQFIDFLLAPETENILASSMAAQIPLRKAIKGPEIFPPISEIKTMKVDYSTLATTLEKIMKGFLKEWVDNNS